MNAPLALTMGDPAGIGAEIAIGAWAHRADLEPFFLIDDPERIRALVGSGNVASGSSGSVSRLLQAVDQLA